MRKLTVYFAAMTLFGTAAYAADSDSLTAASDTASPVATVTLKGGSVAAGVGYTWGHGELTYRDAPYQFSIKGVSIVDVGATSYTAAGDVYNLKDISDFSGNYFAADAGIAVAGGGTAIYLKNEHGVVIKLASTDVGLKFNLSANGVRIALKS